jgi:oligopeptide transport system substrate-binding protein
MARLLLAMMVLLAGGVLVLRGLADAEPRADLTYVNPSGIHTLDPARMSWTQDFRIAFNIWEGLTTYDPVTAAPSPGAAKFPPEVSEDGLTYTFHLRRDARWSDGSPVTADDFIRGWRRAFEPGTAADYSFLFTEFIDGAAAYAAWRQQAVGVLAPLSRLRSGWGITGEQARTLAGSPAWSIIEATADTAGLNLPNVPNDDTHLASPSAPASSPSTATAPASAWTQFARRLQRADVDWDELHARMFDAHVAELEDRFARVGLTAQGADTLVVRLAKPCPFLLDLAAFPTFVPIHKSAELLREHHRRQPLTAEGLAVYDPQWTKPNYHRDGYPGLITNGPYRLAEWRFKRRALLTVNPHHRAADELRCRSVAMVVYEDPNTALMAYEAGDVDFLPAMDVPYDHEIARLARRGDRPDFHLCVTLATYFFNFNCASPEVRGVPNPLLDARVRRALSLCVDRPALVEQVLQRGDRIAYSFVPPNAVPGYEPPPGLPFDPERARALLAEAGYPNGNGLPPLDLLYTPTDERVCQAVARMWEEHLGVRVELRAKESKTFAEDKANLRYMIARANWYADYNDASTFLDCLLTSNGNNDSGYHNPAYDALLEEASRTQDAAARARILQQAEALILQEDCPILPILHYATPIAIKPYVRGLHPNPRLIFLFRYVEIDRQPERATHRLSGIAADPHPTDRQPADRRPTDQRIADRRRPAEGKP